MSCPVRLRSDACKRKPPTCALLVPAVILATPHAALAHPGYLGTAFHAHDYPSALRLAEKENKIVLLHVGNNPRGWKSLRWASADRHDFTDLLMRETVTVELDATSADDLANAPVSERGIFLFSAGGKQIASFALDAHHQAVQRFVESYSSSEQGLTQIAEHAKHKPESIFAQERYGMALVHARKTDQAIRILDKCLEQAIDGLSPASTMRRPRLIEHMAKLGEQNPKAYDSLKKNRDRLAQRVRSNKSSAKLGRDLARMNQLLGEEQNSVQLFLQPSTTAPARVGIFDSIAPSLLEEQRYQDIVSMVDPVVAVEGEIDIHRNLKIKRPASAKQGSGRGSKAFVVQRALMFVEAFAAQGEDEQALAVLHMLLAFDNAKGVSDAARRALERADRPELAKGIGEGVEK